MVIARVSRASLFAVSATVMPSVLIALRIKSRYILVGIFIGVLLSFLIIGADGDGANVIVECECVVGGVDEEADASEANTLVKDKLYIEGNAIVEVRGGVCFDVTLDDVAAEIFVGAFVEHTEKVAFGEVGFEFLDSLFYIGELVDGGVLLVDCDFHFCVPFLRCVVVVWFAVVPSLYHTMRGVLKGD